MTRPDEKDIIIRYLRKVTQSKSSVSLSLGFLIQNEIILCKKWQLLNYILRTTRSRCDLQQRFPAVKASTSSRTIHCLLLLLVESYLPLGKIIYDQSRYDKHLPSQLSPGEHSTLNYRSEAEDRAVVSSNLTDGKLIKSYSNDTVKNELVINNIE